MPKQLNQVQVNLAFTADTTQAKKQLQDLQKSLTNLTNNSFGNKELGLTKEIENATAAAAQLKVQLQSATNPQTGKLDLGLFDDAMKKSGMSLEKYRDQLVQLGPEGQKAFLGLAQSITNAELPLKRSSQVLDQFATALKNTVRWQISSSALHGFMSAVQGAYGYAQNLDKSLNSIRIVSGQSSEQMAELAEHANKAAQALNTSTLAYTDAALIYYQQGLDSDEVAKRTEATLKMSNVTGESASEVSSYMTAIWNNFAEGSDNLEHFADVITALGASTASSSREIAGGMQQFAAVANTVGLSYEYAASALATIVAQTRQSESTVGNGLRTIFARFDSVKLGETLEDGVGLTKYTEALQKAGVSVLDQNGQLKEMDQILDEIGAKWENLDKTQKTALAQTVGGVRQYTNLMALFDNWDSFQRNLLVAQNSDGSLEAQAEIYAESWEAARKRVQAAWQSIYQDLIDEKFFITVLDGIQSILQGVDGLIDGLGGLPGILTTIATAFSFLFEKQISKSLENLAYNIKMLTPAGRESVESIRDEARKLSLTVNGDTATVVGETTNTNLQNTAVLQEALYKNAHRMSEEEIKINQILLDGNKSLQDRNIKLAESVDLAEKEYSKMRSNLLKQTQKEYGEDFDLTEYQQGRQVLEEFVGKYEELLFQREKEGASLEELEEIQFEYNTVIDKTVNYYHLNAKAADEYINSVEQLRQKQRALQEGTDLLLNAESSLLERFKGAGLILKSTSDDIVKVSQSILTLSQLFTSIKSLAETWNDKNLNIWEKLGRTLQVGATSALLLSQAFKQQNREAGKNLTITLANIVSGKAYATTKASEAKNTVVAIAATEGDTVAKTKETLATKLATIATSEFAAALGTLLLYFGPIIIATMAIVAAYKQWDVETETLAERNKRLTDDFKDINTALSDMQSAASEAAEAYENLANKLDNLENVSDKINELTQGTSEWKKAISDANGELLETLQATGQLEKAKLEYDNKGLLKVSNPEEVKQGSLNNVLYKQFTASMTQVAKSEVAKELSASNASQKLNTPIPKFLDFLASSSSSGWSSLIKNILLPGASGAAKDVVGWIQSYDTKKTQVGDKGSANNEADLTAMAQALVDAGISWDKLDKNTAEWLATQDDSLKFLADIADRQDILDAINNVAQSILKQDVTSEAFKTEALRQAFEQAGIEIPKILLEQGGKFATPIYNKITSDILSEHGVQTVSDLDISEGSKIRDEALQAFANQSNGKYEFLGGELVEGEKNVTEEINEELIKRAYLYQEFAEEVKNKYSQAGQQEQLFSNSIQQIGEEQYSRLRKFLGDINTEDGQTFSEQDLNIVMHLSDEQLKEIGGWQGLREYLDELEQQHTVPVRIDTEDLNNFKGNSKKTAQEDLEAEVGDLADYIQKNIKNIDNLSDHLAECREQTERLAYSIIRFDDAIQDVTSNYEDWSKTLKEGSMQEQVKLGKELEKVYANLFDLDTGKFLQADFTQDAENLDLMKQAVEGVGDAYDVLLEKAAREIITTIKPEMSEADLNNVFTQLNSIEEEFGKEWRVGDNINCDPLYNFLNQLIQDTANSVEEANAILQALGYDAVVTDSEDTTEDEQNVTGYKAIFEPTYGAFRSPMISPDGSSIPSEDSQAYMAQHLRYEQTEPVTIKSVKKNTASALKIEPGSLHKRPTGTVKYQNASHGGGSQNPSKASPKSSGKGSSPKSASPKKKTVKEHKEPKKEEDRYHDLKERIDDVNTALKRMGKTKDRVYGKAKLKYMDQELARMKDQIALTKEYIKEAEKYLKVDRAALEGIKKGAAFDENGMLTNYEEVLKNITEAYNNQLAQYNKAVDKFNASEQEEGDNTALEAEEKALAKAEKTFNENKQILKQYEDTYNLIQKQQEELIDQLNEYYDTLLENVDIKVKMKIDLEEDDKKLLEWMYKYIGDSADYAADKIANLSKQMKASKNELDIMREGITEIFKNHDMDVDVNNLDADDLVAQLRAYMNQEGLASEMTEAEVEKLREYRDALMEYYDQMYDNMVEGNEVLREMMEEQDDRIQRQIDNYDRLADAIEHWNDIAELTGEDVLGLNTQELNRLDQSRVTNDWNRMDSTKRYMEEREREYLRLQQSYAEAQEQGDKMVLAQVKESLELAEDLYHEAQEAWRDSWKKAQEDVNQAAENAMDRMVKDYKRALGDLDVLMERYDRQKENNHLYLEDYEKYHELNKSMKDLQNSMNNTNNQKMLSKMRDLEDEINANMQNGVKISERQAEVIARRVALLQAEAELMDAQNAKNAVRMTRDNEGNFSYTYTADQEQIDDAEQNYGDKFYELMKYEKDEIEALEAERLQSEAQYIEDLRNLWDEYRNGDISSYEEYLALVDELTAQYEERRQYYSDQEAFLFDEQARLRDEDWKDFEEITGNKLAEQHNFVDEFEDTITGQLLPGYQTLDEAQAEWAQVMSDGYETAKTTAAEWQAAAQNTLKQAGTDADNFKIKMLTDLGEIDKQSEVTKDKIENMISGPGGMAEKFDEGIAASDKFNQEFAAHNEAEREQIRQTVEALNEMIRKLAETNDWEQTVEKQSGLTKTALDTAAESAKIATDAFEDAANAANDAAGAASAAAGAMRDAAAAAKELADAVSNTHPVAHGPLGGWYDGPGITYDTGGYTGDFGPAGKWAILHEKEIVLNKEDTANMLNIVGMVRNMVSSFNINQRLDNLLSMVTAATGIAEPQAQSLDQNVHIEASFPNVQSHSEIELALNNLINSASQFVNRK